MIKDMHAYYNRDEKKTIFRSYLIASFCRLNYLTHVYMQKCVLYIIYSINMVLTLNMHGLRIISELLQGCR
jgi:hypothetical protein